MFRILGVLALGVASIASLAAIADDCRSCKCDRCGCQSQCHKVCRLVCEMKEVKETHYCCKCEDFCVPGPSSKCGTVCEPDNFECPCDNCAKHCSWFDCLFSKEKRRTVWSPSCESTMLTKTKLVKYQVPKQVPTYKWVVEYCCDRCNCETTEKPEKATTPPPAPQADTTVKSPPSPFKTTSATTTRIVAPSEPLPLPIDSTSATIRATDLPLPNDVPASLDLPHAELPSMRIPMQKLDRIPWERLDK